MKKQDQGHYCNFPLITIILLFPNHLSLYLFNDQATPKQIFIYLPLFLTSSPRLVHFLFQPNHRITTAHRRQPYRRPMAQLRDRVRTRSALLSMEPASASATSAETSSKRSKIAINTTTSREELLRFSPSSSVQLESTTSTSDGGGAPPPPEQRFSGATSDESPCCSSNEKTITKFSDPEVESARAETASCDGRDEEEETTRKREMSTSHGTSSQEVDSVEEKEKLQKMPTESELEEFFSAAEKDIQKRFSHKYNYDIVKDVPLEGRYEWVQLKP